MPNSQPSSLELQTHVVWRRHGGRVGRRAEIPQADVLIAPGVSIMDMRSVTQRDEAIPAGYTMAQVAMPTILDLIEHAPCSAAPNRAS